MAKRKVKRASKKRTYAKRKMKKITHKPMWRKGRSITVGYGIVNKRQYGVSNESRDKMRPAKPVGWRIAKNGKRYWEARKNRSDRVAPDYKRKKYSI